MCGLGRCLKVIGLHLWPLLNADMSEALKVQPTPKIQTPESDQARLGSGSTSGVWASCSRNPLLAAVLGSAFLLLSLAQLHGEERCQVEGYPRFWKVDMHPASSHLLVGQLGCF